jgi:hypothetical protein
MTSRRTAHLDAATHRCADGSFSVARTNTRHSTARSCSRALAVVAALCCGHPFALGAQDARPAQTTDRLPPGAVAAAGVLPSNVDVVLVVEDAAALRQTPIGLGALTFLKDTGSLVDVVEAWSGLAKELGWSESETFDRLLGTRAVFVARDSAGAGATERRWALLSDVSPQTQARLKERLQAAPRAIEGGRQILSIERGKFELAAQRADPRAGDDQSITIVLGPAGKGELFDEVVRNLTSGAQKPLARTPALEQASKAGTLDVLMLLRVRGSVAKQPDDWSDFMLFAGRRAGAGERADAADDGRSWHTRVVLRESARIRDLRAVPVTSDAPFRALSDRSLLTIVQAAPLNDVLGTGSPVQTILGSLPLPDEAKPLISGRQAFVLRQREGAGDADSLFSATVAMETTDVSALARILDGAMSRGIQTIEQRFGIAAPPPRDFGGVAPGAARVVPFAAGDNSPLKLVSAKPLSIAWAYPSEPTVAKTDAPRSGWWVLNLSQTPIATTQDPAPATAEALSSDARALFARAPDASLARWVCLAEVQSQKLEALLPAALPDIRDIRSFLRRFERLGVRLSITDEGDIQGDIDLRLAETR